MNLINPLIYIYMNGKEENYFAPVEKLFDYGENVIRCYPNVTFAHIVDVFMLVERPFVALTDRPLR